MKIEEIEQHLTELPMKYKIQQLIAKKLPHVTAKYNLDTISYPVRNMDKDSYSIRINMYNRETNELEVLNVEIQGILLPVLSLQQLQDAMLTQIKFSLLHVEEELELHNKLIEHRRNMAAMLKKANDEAK